MLSGIIVIKDQNYFWLTEIICICLLLIVYSYRSKRKKLLIFSSVFIFLHLIVFPLLYLNTIESNSRSFEFDNYIVESESRTSLSELQDIYKPNEIDRKLNWVNLILNDSSHLLDSSFQYLEDGSIITLKELSLYRKDTWVVPDKWPRPTVVICNSKGDFEVSFIEYKDVVNDKVRIRSYFKKKMESLLNEKNLFSTKIQKVDELGEIWEYHKILPYTLNIFSNENIKPKSREANLIYALHNILTVILLGGIIVNEFIVSFTRRRKQSNIQ